MKTNGKGYLFNLIKFLFYFMQCKIHMEINFLYQSIRHCAMQTHFNFFSHLIATFYIPLTENCLIFHVFENFDSKTTLSTLFFWLTSISAASSSHLEIRQRICTYWCEKATRVGLRFSWGSSEFCKYGSAHSRVSSQAIKEA